MSNTLEDQTREAREHRNTLKRAHETLSSSHHCTPRSAIFSSDDEDGNDEDDKLHIAKFTYTEFLHYITNTKRLPGNGASSEFGNKSFTGTKSWKEAMDFAKYGWDSGIQMLKDIDTINVNGCLETEFDLQGGAIDIGRFIAGHSDCMINFIDNIEREKPQITMFVNLGYCAWVNEENVQRYLKQAIKIIYSKLIKYDVRVYGFIGTSVNKNFEGQVLDYCFVKLKDFGQQIVLNNFVFAFHPSFFRRLWFRFFETKPHWDNGYGRTPSINLEKLLENNGLIEGETWIFPNIEKISSCDLEKEDIEIIK